MLVFPAYIIVSSFMSLILFDYLVWKEFTSERREWNKDGRPRGFFWQPSRIDRDGGNQPAYFANYRLSFLWLTRTPDWMRRKRAPLIAVVAMRMLVASNILLVPLLLIAYSVWK